MPHLFDDFDATIKGIERWQERQRQVQTTADSITPSQAANISRLARMFPFMSPGVVRGLGQAGFGPDDAATQFAITQEMLRNFSTVGDWSGQLGRVQRKTNHPTKTMPDAPTRRITSGDEARALNSFDNPAVRNEQMGRAQRLLKEGETLGVFNPTTQMLVEPEFEGEDGGRAHRVFSRLQDIVYQISKSPVPYLSRDGVIRGFTPLSGTTGDLELSLSTGQQILPEDQPDPTITGAYRNPSGVGGSIGVVEDYGRGQQQQLSSDIISQIFAESEANPITAKTIEAGQVKVSQAGISGESLLGLPNTGRQVGQAAFVAFDAPIQEVQGQVRNVYGAIKGEDVDWLESQSDLGIIAGKIAKGQEVDIGTGFFVDPESAVARERRAREAERGQIGGHNVTIGRILASTVTDPNSKPFQIISGLVDGAAAVYADPTALGLGKVSKAQDAAKGFKAADEIEAAGAFKGIRHYFDPPTFQQWANKNTKLLDKFAETSDAYDIAKLTNFKLPVRLTSDLANTTDPGEIRALLDDAVNSGHITARTNITGTKMQRAKHGWDEAHRKLNPHYNPRTLRMAKMMPQQTLDLENPEQVATNILRALENAHATEDDIRGVYNLVAGAQTRNGLRDAIMESQTRVGGLLEYYGVRDPEVRSFLTRINQSTYNEDLRGLIDEVGSDVPTWETMAVNGQQVNVTGPHLPLEHIGRYMNLPDQRAVRRLTSRYSSIFAKGTDIPVLPRLKIRKGEEIVTKNIEMVGQPRLPIAAADWIMSEFIKPSWLMRLAWPIRVVGEEQLRMAGAGLDSAVKHPLSYIATVIGGEQNRLTRMLDRMTPGIKGKMETGPAGELLSETEALNAVTYRAHSAWLDQPGVVRTNIPTIYHKNSVHELADYRSSWAHELALLHHDPVSHFVSNNAFEDAVEWMFSGAGNKYRRELMEAHPGNLETRAQVAKYLQTVTDRISRMTANHPDLIDIVKTGKWSKFKDGDEVVSSIFREKPGINPEFTHHLRGYEDVGPDKMKGVATSASHRGQDFMDMKRQVVDRMFSVLMGTPTSTLSRAPAFKQFMWRRVAELLPYADDATRKTILANAKKAGLNKRQMKNLEVAAKKGKRAADDVSEEFAGTLNTDEIDLLAKGYAVDDTKELLYDLSERSQITDIMRILVPFGEAWKEVLTRWAKLATIRGPGGIPLPGKAVRRAQQTIQGARGSDFGNLMGAGIDPVTGKDRGFFFENEFGEEVYVYPGSQFATSSLTGIPVPLTGRVQGLNMFGNILPSIGPAAQIPVAWFLQDKPQYDWWREQLLPFGGPGAEETADIFAMREYLPSFAKTALDWVTEGGEDDRLYASNIMYVSTYLYSTGEYGDTVDEQQRLMEDAKEAARDLYKVRALGQFILPSSPTFEWITKTENGDLINTRILAQEFYELQQEDYDTAVEKFMEMYGPDSIGAIVPHSRNVISAVPTSLEGAQWVAKHPSIKKRFDLVYGFFAPEGEFHMPTYARNYMTGEREAITPKQWRNMMDTMLGNYHYQRAKKMLGEDANSPNRDQQTWLYNQRRSILEAYPNWDNNTGLAQRPENEQMIRQLYEAAKNPTIKKTNAGKGLIEYLGYRDKAMAQAIGPDPDNPIYRSFKTANDLAPTRTWLISHASRIIERYPEFEKLWDVVFSREMEDAVIEDKDAA